MAKEVVYKDDVTGEEIMPDLVGGDPSMFLLDDEGNLLVIDAGIKTRDAHKKAQAKYLEKARKADPEETERFLQRYGLLMAASRGGRSSSPAKSSATSSAAKPTGSGRSPEELQAVRDWWAGLKADENGLKAGIPDREVAARGRIAGDILAAFDKAHA